MNSLAQYPELEHFLPKNQALTLQTLLKGEESEHFREVLARLALTVRDMPSPGDTAEQEDPTVHLHYFSGSSDWWIIEKDLPGPQIQMFCYACLNGWTDCAELGYVSLPEIIEADPWLELDFYWEPKPLREVIKSVREGG